MKRMVVRSQGQGSTGRLIGKMKAKHLPAMNLATIKHLQAMDLATIKHLPPKNLVTLIIDTILYTQRKNRKLLTSTSNQLFIVQVTNTFGLSLTQKIVLAERTPSHKMIKSLRN